MQNDLRTAEIDLRRRGAETLQRYGKDPSAFSKNIDEPDLDEVKKIMNEVNKNRTKKRGFFFKNEVKAPKMPKPVETAPTNVNKKPKMGFMDRTAKNVGYGTMGVAGLGGLYAANTGGSANVDPYGGSY